MSSGSVNLRGQILLIKTQKCFYKIRKELEEDLMQMMRNKFKLRKTESEGNPFQNFLNITKQTTTLDFNMLVLHKNRGIKLCLNHYTKGYIF